MAICEDDVDIDRDRELVQRFQAGDRDAFDLLYVRYFARLTRFCARRVEDSSEAEELAQEAFARAYRALPRLSGEQRFYPWLSVIASRVCVDHYRSRTRAAKVPVFEDRGVEGGQDVVFDEVDRLQVTAALDRLRPRHQDVLRLREQMGWSYGDIARHYDVTIGTVQLLLFRARHALRREFAAIAGDGRLAGVPVLAWLAAHGRAFARRVARAAPLGDGISMALQPLAVLGLVVGAVVLSLGVGSHAGATSRVSSPTSSVFRSVPVASRTEAASRPAPPRPAANDGLPSTLGPVHRRAFAPGDDQVESMPIRVRGAGYTVGVDPDATSADAVQSVDSYMGDVRRRVGR